MLAVLTCVPAAVAGFTGNAGVALRYLAVILLFAVYGALTARIRVAANMQRNEALVITALVFTLSDCVMAFPLMGYGIPFVDAVFEAVSGVTTTGLSTLGNVEGRPIGFLFGRAWMQWVGGLGVLALVLALLIEPGVAAKRLGFDEHVDIAGGTQAPGAAVPAPAGAVVLSVLAAILFWLGVYPAPLIATLHAMAESLT